jgi:hypothetical protein
MSPEQNLRNALLKRLKARNNYAPEITFLLETLRIVLVATGFTEGRLSRRFCGGPGHIKRWFTEDYEPTIEDKARVLELLSEEVRKTSRHFELFAESSLIAAILNRDRQDPEGDVDTAEPTSGGSGE